jgi:mRNA interferase MazF
MVGRQQPIPDRGDVVWLNFDPQAGHEQAGRRPALVLSPAPYNRRIGLMLVCPVTRQMKGYPFEVAIPDGLVVSGVVLSDHVKSLDWRVRDAAIVGRLPGQTVEQVIAKIEALLRS